MSTIHTSDESFEKDVLKNEKLVLVDFWASWCSPCVALSPILEEISEDAVYEFAFIGGSLKLRGADAAPMRPIAIPLR